MVNTFRSILLVTGLCAGASAAQADPGGARATAIAGLERTDSAPGTGANDGFYYGGQLGYDWDLGRVIAGVEGELGGSSARDRLVSGGAKQGVFAEAAVRLAIPLWSDFRVFARGGYAYHKIDYVSAPDFSGSGYTIGGGAEYDLTERLLIRADYRYSDYGQTVRGQRFLGGLGVRF